MRIGLVVFDQDYRIYIVADAVFGLHLLPDLGLERSKSKLFFAIVANDKVDRAIAKIAYAIEKYDRAHVKSLQQFRREA